MNEKDYLQILEQVKACPNCDACSKLATWGTQMAKLSAVKPVGQYTTKEVIGAKTDG